MFLRKLAKQGYAKYAEGSEFVDTREDLMEMGDPDGGGLKELDEKLKTRIENLKDMVLYRFGSTGVVQVLSRAADLLGLVPIFPVRNIHGFGSGGATASAVPGGGGPVFRDCILVMKGSTVKDCARKVMGDAPLAYVEGAGGVRVSEDEVVEVGKFDVGNLHHIFFATTWLMLDLGLVVQGGQITSEETDGRNARQVHPKEIDGELHPQVAISLCVEYLFIQCFNTWKFRSLSCSELT